MNNYSKENDEEFTSSIKKELELAVEKEKLKESIDIIKNEILLYIGKRKELTSYILEYRKNALDEFRNDEDKIIDYFDHERFVKEESFKSIDRRLKELIILKNTPYFGKVNFKEADMEEEYIYIGRFGVTPEGSYEPLVVDWRAPVASLFYSGKLGEAVYKAPMGDVTADIKSKRQFIIKKSELVGMFDTSVDVKDDILQMVLSSNSSEKLKDIVMTIQSEQDEIIRQPYDITMVVNGVAGSGKTTIALHRVAYLLYNYRERLQDKVLILGPNSIFMEYISMVLPSLGEVGVKQSTFSDYAMSKLNIHEVMPFKDYMDRILSDDKEFINKALYKASEDFEKVIESKIDEVNKHYFDIKEVTLLGKPVVDKAEIKEMFENYFKDMPLFRRSKKIRRIIFSKIKDVRDDLVREVQREYKETIAKMTPRELQLEGNQVEFMRRNKIREIIRGVLDCKQALAWIENPNVLEIYETINGKDMLTYDDLAPLLYIDIKLRGNVVKEDIKHVVIDEAQDYSSLQFKVIKEITGCLSMTIVGDSNQRILPCEGEVPMVKLDKILNGEDIKFFGLEKSYRSTKEIMEYANNFIGGKIVPLVRSGNKVKEISAEKEHFSDTIKEMVEDLNKKGYESIALVCRDMEATKEIQSLLSPKLNIKVMDTDDIIYSGGTVLIPSYYAKGLEFDSVIIVKHGDIQDLQKDAKINYVMCTRALHELNVINIK
ncbi:AAA family ATPase [Clostridium sp. 19966]|nr:AAA family ATPase [Clostridium sp. 19966]